MEKRCFCCGQTKSIADFYEHPGMADGHLGKCNECCKAYALKRRNEKLEEIREYDRKRGRLPHRIQQAIEQTIKWRAADRRRTMCHNAVARALRKGSLTPLDCERCGRPDSQAHHDDYDKPLEVTWLCPVCHKKRHKELKRDIESLTAPPPRRNT